MTPKERYNKSAKGKETRKRYGESAKARETNKRYYETHKENYRRYWKEQRVRDPIAWKERMRRNERKFNSTPKGIWHILKSNSRVKKREFLLDKDEFIKWYLAQNKICHYCQLPEGENRLEIDRMDNSIGYILTNITLACEQCNGVKGKYLTYNEMKIVGELVMKKRWKI